MLSLNILLLSLVLLVAVFKRASLIVISQVKMTDLTSGEELNFKVNRWMSRSEDDRDVWRELPVVRKGQKPLPGGVSFTVAFVA